MSLEPEGYQQDFKQVENPTPLEGGSAPEAREEPTSRTSNRLRHKGRAVTLWDYQQMVLEQFPTVYKVGAVIGAIAALVVIAWMVSDIKGPRGRLDQDQGLAIETSTNTPVPVSPTASTGADAGAGSPTVIIVPSVTSTPTLQPIEINFNADAYSIVQGECTTLRWQVVGADTVYVEGAEVEHTEAESVCPSTSTRFRLTARNANEEAESSFTIEVLTPTATEEQMGCTGYDQNGQLVCKETCSDNDPKDPCTLD